MSCKRINLTLSSTSKITEVNKNVVKNIIHNIFCLKLLAKTCPKFFLVEHEIISLLITRRTLYVTIQKVQGFF